MSAAALVCAAAVIALLASPAAQARPASPPPSGSEWTAVVAPAAAEDATSSNNQTKLLRDRDGALIVAYVGIVAALPQIVLARSADGGHSFAAMAQASEGPVPSRLPALARDPEARLGVVWTRYDDGVGKVYYRRWAAGWAGAQTRISPAAAYAGYPGLAGGAGGVPQVVWYGIREGQAPVSSRHGSIYEIFYTGLAAGAWSAPRLISTGIPDSLNPALAAGRAGVLYAAWFQYDGRAYQVRYAERHAAWSAPETVLATRADAFSVDVAAGPSGPPVLVWERHDAQTSVIETTERRGAGWADPRDLSAGPSPARHPSVSVAASGDVYVAWDTDAGDIYVRRRAAHTAWNAARAVAADGGNSFPSILASDDGADLVWTHAAAGRASVRFARIGR